ncbi:MAG: hypothetical protein Kow0098_02050 [Ignavibacteriaceae bacterium]
MKKSGYFLLVFILVIIINDAVKSQIRVCRGTSFDEVVYTIDDPRFLRGESSEVLYTIRDATLCEGTSYDVVFTRRDEVICSGTSYDVLLTMRGYNFCEGTSYDVLYTYRDNKIYRGTTFDKILYTFRDGEPTETVLMYMMAILYTTRGIEGAEDRDQ